MLRNTLFLAFRDFRLPCNTPGTRFLLKFWTPKKKTHATEAEANAPRPSVMMISDKKGAVINNK